MILLPVEMFLLTVVCIAIFNVRATKFLKTHYTLTAIFNALHFVVLDKIMEICFPELGQWGTLPVSIGILAILNILIFRR